MKVSLKSITPDAEINLVEIARVSSSRKDKTESPEGLINYLIRNKHWSPFEHSYMTVEIVTSKAIGIQLLRHRSFTFQEFSQRYAKVQAIEPIELRKQSENNRQSSTEVIDPVICRLADYSTTPVTHHPILASETIANLIETIQDLYDKLLELGVANECARMILPMATQTTIFMTGSIRSWVHFLSIRDEHHSQLEMQLVAKEIKAIFKEKLPIVSKALGY